MKQRHSAYWIAFTGIGRTILTEHLRQQKGIGTMRYLTVVPAYGRDYNSKKEVLAAWDAGSDFQIHQFGHASDGRYINIRDAAADITPGGDGLTVNIRYKRLTQVLPVKVIKGA